MPKPRKKPVRPLTLMEIDRVSLVDKGDNPTAHVMIHKRAEDEEGIEKETQRGRSYQRRCEDVARAVQMKYSGEEGYAYCKETYDDAVIFEQGGKQYRAPYTVEESEGEMKIILGDREQAETVYETAKGEHVELKQVIDKITSLEGTLAETTKRAERAEGIAKLTVDERTHFDKLAAADQDAFLAGDAEFRKQKIEAAKPAPVEKTAEQRRIEVLEKREQDLTERVRKAEDAAELATFVKRASVELPNLPGTDDEKGAMLRAVEKIADPAARDAALKALKAGNAAQESLTKAAGSGRAAAVSDSAEAKIEAEAVKIMQTEKVSKGHAWALVPERHPELWAEYRAESRKGVN